MWYSVGVKNSFQHVREECESKRVMSVSAALCLVCQDRVSSYF